MFDWSFEYVVSQLLIIVVYIFICLSYFLKDRKKILLTNIMAHISQAGSFYLLNGMTGVAMNAVYTIRDVYFVIDNNKKSSVLKEYIVLAVLLLITFCFAIFTYNGLASLLSVLATIVSTIAIWQKNIKYYKLLGIPSSILWLGYHIYLRSIFAIILESILLIFIIVSYIKEYAYGDSLQKANKML